MNVMFSEELREEMENFAKEIKPKFKSGEINSLDILYAVMEYLNLFERQKDVTLTYKQRVEFYQGIVSALKE